jgi:DNA repair protein RecN (Recombination protein N)
VLLELSVQNLLLIEQARLELSGGLNVITGETGAGKTVLAHALDLLLGGRARPGIVRPGAGEAYVEGVFEIPAGLRCEGLPDDAGELVVARRVGADGRTRAYLGGRSIQLTELRELTAELLSFYGQHEHRRLTLGAVQLQVLDDSLGEEQALRRAACAEAWTALRQATAELERLASVAGERERRLDLLEFELSEIEGVDPKDGERDTLVGERNRLRNLDGLRAAAWGAEQALADEDGGALTGLRTATSFLDGGSSLDGEAAALAERARSLEIDAADLLGEIHRFGEALGDEPGRLEALEERLGALARLERKHGGSIAAVLAHAADCRAQRDEIAGAEVAMEAAQASVERARSDHLAACESLSAARLKGAPLLAAAVRARLAEVGMAEASFEIVLAPCEPGRSGAEQVQFEIAPNPGVPAAPLREIASGGELSRVMLALLSAAHGGGSSTLVFDEIDAGIGGHTARAVGEQLRSLAAGRQILAITHLPQVASFAARHFTIAKDTSREPARATVVQLAGGEVLGELVRMLGADHDDAGARRHARELLRAA